MPTHDTETLAEQHVIDRDGMVWRIVRDGGMATRATYTGVISIGIARLEGELGPLVTLAARDAVVAAQAKAEALREVRALADQWEASGDRLIARNQGRTSPAAQQRWVEGYALRRCALALRAASSVPQATEEES